MNTPTRTIISALAFACLIVGVHSADGSDLAASRLRCEHRDEPLGIDEPNPRLGWVLTSTTRGARQTAYQVLVASSPDRLTLERVDLWDTGKVSSDTTFGVGYDGVPLESHQECYWTVRVWDGEGAPSDWSPAARWSMGLLKDSDWTADWIGHDGQRAESLPRAPLDGASWVAHRGDAPGEAPEGARLYVREFQLPVDDEVISAEALPVGDDRFWLAVNGDVAVHDGELWEFVKPVDILGYLVPGRNELRLKVENAARGRTGALMRINVVLASGTTVTIDTDGEWRSVADPQHHWPDRPLGQDELLPCRVDAAYGDPPWGGSLVRGLHLPPTTLLRQEFVADRQVTRATLYATALGLCDVYLNGERVTDDRFTPGWSDYNKRVYYRTYDVTDRVEEGANAIGAALADGWYSGYIGWGRRRDHYGVSPRLRMQLRLEYEDGSSEVIATTEGWKATPSATEEADFLMGERKDARIEHRGWSEPGYDVSSWREVEVGASEEPSVQSHPGPPVVTIDEVTPRAISEPKRNVYIFDMGQYIAGVARLRVHGREGQQIRLRFGERLNPDGTLYTTNLRGARSEDTYVCRGDGVETWEPRFTFHGFQYVEVTGLNSPPGPDAITGVALSSDTERAGEFTCSNPMLNQLVSNIYWTQRANFIEVPTDCPQRDERLGWTGDAQVYIYASCLLADTEAFFAKWLTDLNDGQREDGQFPTVAPLVVAPDDGGPAWADAGVICPWTLYEVYGDRRALERSYPSMKRFVDFCHQRCTPELLPPAEFHCFGDWLSINADTPQDVIYMAYFAHSAELLSRAAAVLDRQRDAAFYDELCRRAKTAFRDEYVTPDGLIKGDTQCGYALAIAYDLLDESLTSLAGERLAASIESRDGHLSTGFVGTKDLMLALSKINRNDIAFRLVQKDTFPSWGFSIKHGAKSIWERWDGWTPGDGFQDPGMNSFAHYSFGAVYRWMVENIGGIQNGGDAYKNIVLSPTFDQGIDSADVSYESIRGSIGSKWSRSGQLLRWEVAVPPNTNAKLHFPGVPAESISEASLPLEKAPGLRVVQNSPESTVVEAGSGNYLFNVKVSDE